MSITTIVTAGAHSAKKHAEVGDQYQTGVPDYSGEVSLRQKNEQQFHSSYDTYALYRFIDVGHAHDFADLMIRACNNPNIGYSQAKRDGIFQYGVDSTARIACDCSSLISYCITKATGVSINGTTSGLASLLPESGLFMTPVAVTSINFTTNMPYNGDILLKRGSHVEAVVSGNPREGRENEITSGTWEGYGDTIIDYTNSTGYETKAFVKRNSAPTNDNRYYQQSYGGTANGSYAWGRFSEILGSECNLNRGIPRRWYVTTEDGYSRGPVPSEGAVMCFTHLYNIDHPGAVAIVEEVNNNDIRLTWKDPTTGLFSYFRTTKNKEGKWDMDLDNDGKYEFQFQGCIYNPGVAIDKAPVGSVGDFVDNAEAQVGNLGSFVQTYTDVVPKRDPWAAAFIVAVAIITGVADELIPYTFSCSNIGRMGVDLGMGQFLLGPAQGGNPVPHRGDIMLLRTTALKWQDPNPYGADKAGIVSWVGQSNGYRTGYNQTSSMVVEVIMGDVNGKVDRVQFATDSQQISGYFRPNWEDHDGYHYDVLYRIDDKGLYLEPTTLEDAAIRDIRYLGGTSEPSITLAAINYTGMIANLYTAFVESGTAPGYATDFMIDDSILNGSTERGDIKSTLIGEDLYTNYADTLQFMITNGNSIMGAKGAGSGTTRNIVITPTVQYIYQTLANALGNEAAAIGILGNILQENGTVNPGVKSSNNACGLCQWLGNRRTNMQSYCANNGGDWTSNLSGQVSFILKELDEDLPGLKKTLNSVPNTIEGAQTACDAFMRKFERCGNYDSEGLDRDTWTQGYWQLIKGN